MTDDRRPRWYRTLRFRLAFLLAVSYLIAHVLGELAIAPFVVELYPEWYDAEFLRGRAAAIEDARLHQRSLEDVDARFPETYEEVEYPFVLLVSMALAVILAVTISVVATRRLERLAGIVSQPPSDLESLPGPFDESGNDEIALLARAMNKMRDRVQALVRRLAERDRWRREWIEQTAHDLRTPLAALMAASSRAGEAAGQLPPSALRQQLDDAMDGIQVDADRMRVLVENLLESARLDTEAPLRLAVVPVGELLRECLGVVRPLAVQRGLQLEMTLPESVPTLRADGSRLKHAVENLLRNAIQHAQRRVRMTTWKQGQTCWIEICDDGGGTAVPLRRTPLTELIGDLRAQGVAGVGLVVVQKVVEAHGGEAEVQRGEEETAVRLSLPIGTD